MIFSCVALARGGSTRGRLWRLGAAGLVALFYGIALDHLARAEAPEAGKANPAQAATSLATRQEAIQSIPLAKMDPQAQAKVKSVLGSVTVYRRLPARMVECDPDLYLFLVRHPDVVVNIWEVLKLSQLQLRQTGPGSYRVVERQGTTASFEYLWRSGDLHVVYGEGVYTGSLLPRPVTGRALLILRSGYRRQSDGRHYVANRMDTFLAVDPGAAELVARLVQPMLGKVADGNFSQSVSFLGSLSRTAEVNSPGVQRLAGKLTHVQPELRQQLAQLAALVAQRAAAYAPGESVDAPAVATREEGPPQR